MYFKISSFMLILFLSQTISAQKIASTPQTQASPIRDFCFNVVKPGQGGCPVGEDIPAETPLLEAIRQRDILLVKKLIAEGADVNKFNSGGLTPLLMVAGGDFELIDILLKAGADVNAETKYGRTPLIQSTFCSKAVAKFIQAGANINYQNINKKTALMAASEYGNMESVKILLAAGAEIHLKNLDEWTPLTFAVKSGDIGIVKLFFNAGAKNDLQNERDAVNALSIAAGNSDAPMVKTLLEAGASPNAKGKYGTTAITIAAMRNNREVVRLLIFAGADVNIRGPQTAAPLTWASNYGYTEIVTLLLEAKADVNVKEDWSPLISAARKEHIETMKVLLRAGANINQPAYDGKTALMETSERGMIEVVRLLIQNGADINYREKYSRATALSLAIKSSPLVSSFPKINEVIQVLKEAGAVE